MSFRIDRATPDDVGVILGLIKELAEFERLSHQVVATPEQIEVALFAEHPVAEAYVGRLDDVPIAFMLCFRSFSTFLGRSGIYLEDLYVRPPYRGRGFGRRLLAYLARQARDRGCGRVEWSVLNWNTRAIDAYHRVGAVPMNEWTVYRLTGDALHTLASEEPDER